MEVRRGQSQPLPHRRLGGRLELWLVGMAAGVLVLPLLFMLALRAVAGPSGDSLAGSLVVVVATVYFTVGLPVGGGLIIATLFVVVRRKLGGP